MQKIYSTANAFIIKLLIIVIVLYLGYPLSGYIQTFVSVYYKEVQLRPTLMGYLKKSAKHEINEI